MGKLSITLQRSCIGHPRDQRETVRSLGLRRMHQTIIVKDEESIRGMLRKVRHLVRVEPVEESEAKT